MERGGQLFTHHCRSAGLHHLRNELVGIHRHPFHGNEQGSGLCLSRVVGDACNRYIGITHHLPNRHVCEKLLQLFFHFRI